MILSGKGGTGKTTLASAFIKLSDARAYADCDVDAPNLHLVMSGRFPEPNRTNYISMPKARIDITKCIGCGKCVRNCRFNAIDLDPGHRVDIFACEGCGVCEVVCPVGAISLSPAIGGELMLYANNCSVFSTAMLRMGSGTPGKLVSEVKKHMAAAVTEGLDLAIIDGSPGIGCPIIASLSGVDMVLIVTEPSVSGISDMERIIKTAEIFRTRICVCVNKYDINPNKTENIVTYCLMKGLPFVGMIPFDKEAVKVTNEGLSIVDSACTSGMAVRGVFDRTMELLFEESSCANG